MFTFIIYCFQKMRRALFFLFIIIVLFFRIQLVVMELSLSYKHCIALAKEEMGKQKFVYEEEMKIFSQVSKFKVFYEEIKMNT